MLIEEAGRPVRETALRVDRGRTDVDTAVGFPLKGSRMHTGTRRNTGKRSHVHPERKGDDQEQKRARRRREALERTAMNICEICQAAAEGERASDSREFLIATTTREYSSQGEPARLHDVCAECANVFDQRVREAAEAKP